MLSISLRSLDRTCNISRAWNESVILQHIDRRLIFQYKGMQTFGRVLVSGDLYFVI